VRGVALGRVDLPKTRRSGLSATVGFVMVIALLIVGGTLAVSGGGGILGSGGRFFAPEATPSPTPVMASAVDPVGGETSNGDIEEPTPKATGTKFEYTCDDAAITDLSKGKWRVSAVPAGLRTEDDGSRYDQVYWKLSRTSAKKTRNPTTVTMQWTTPEAAKERFGDAIGRVQGDRAVLITFNGPVDITAKSTIETDLLEREGIDQVKRVQVFERNGKVRTIIGLRSDSCARMRAIGWGKKAKADNARIELDFERF
jgi:hypothetical protein